MLQARRSSTAYRDTGLLAIGMSCFGPVWVNGRSLVPAPPWRTMPFTTSHPTLNLPSVIVAYDNSDLTSPCQRSGEVCDEIYVCLYWVRTRRPCSISPI